MPYSINLSQAYDASVIKDTVNSRFIFDVQRNLFRAVYA